MNAYLNKENLEKTKQVNDARVVFIINQKESAVLDVEMFKNAITALPSFHHCVIALPNPLPLTIDLLTCPCLVSLVSDAQETIAKDEKKLRVIFEQSLKN